MTWPLTTIAVLLIAYAVASRRLAALNVSGAMFFTTAGLLAGPVLGLLDAGVLGGLALRLAAGHHSIEPHWMQILSAAAALLAAAVASALGGSIFIAAFTAGFLFGVLRRDEGGEVTYLVDEGGELFNAVTFIVLARSSSARCSTT